MKSYHAQMTSKFFLCQFSLTRSPCHKKLLSTKWLAQFNLTSYPDPTCVLEILDDEKSKDCCKADTTYPCIVFENKSGNVPPAWSWEVWVRQKSSPRKSKKSDGALKKTLHVKSLSTIFSLQTVFCYQCAKYKAISCALSRFNG